MKRRLLACLLLAAFSPAFSQQSPFCVVPQSGMAQCHFYDLSSCQREAQQIRGLCAPNTTQAAPSVPPKAPSSLNFINTPDVASGFLNSYNRAASAPAQAAAPPPPARTPPAPVGYKMDAEAGGLADVAMTATGLHRACGYAEAINGPMANRINADEDALAAACLFYTEGAFSAATSSAGFSSPDKSVSFCVPRSGASANDLRSEILRIGRSMPASIAPGMTAGALLMLGLASLSSCPIKT